MRRLSRLVTIVAVIVISSARAEASPIPVFADATVVGGLFADNTFGDETSRGGLLTGVDGSGLFGPYRFYLLFMLPAFTPNTQVASATLKGFYNDDWDTFDDRTHSIYQSATSWTESTITWNNQPGSVGGALGGFNPAAATPGTFLTWNVTDAVNAAYQGNALLFSLLFRADNEALGVAPFNNNLEYFASREFLGQGAFSLDVQVVDAAAVPDASSTLALFGVAATGLAMVRRRLGRS